MASSGGVATFNLNNICNAWFLNITISNCLLNLSFLCTSTYVNCVLFVVSAFSKTQWNAVVTGRYMTTMMVLLCYVNLSGMSLECIVIALMNNLLLGGQECTDSVDLMQNSDNVMGHNRLAIIPRLNFTCNGRITSIRARMSFNRLSGFPFFQVWRATSVGSTMYNKISQVQLPRGVTSVAATATFDLNDNTIDIQSGDVVGYYHPNESRYRVRDIQTEGYVLYQFIGSHETVDLNNSNIASDDNRQPLIQFTIGKYIFNSYMIMVYAC